MIKSLLQYSASPFHILLMNLLRISLHFEEIDNCLINVHASHKEPYAFHNRYI